jgi:hypothetical protein
LRTCTKGEGGAAKSGGGGGGECRELLTVDLHISDSNADEESLAVLMRPGCLPSMA